MADGPKWTLAELYVRMVLFDLKRSGLPKGLYAEVINATVSTTVAALRVNRSYALAENPTARQLSSFEWEFEQDLLGSLGKNMPSANPGRKKGQTAPDAAQKIQRIKELRLEGRNWREIAEALRPEFGHASPESYKALYARYAPRLPFLRRVLRFPKGHAGRPKSKH